MRFLVVSNFQHRVVGTFNMFLNYLLVAIAAIYLSDLLNSVGFALMIVVTYLLSEAYLIYIDGDDVIYVQAKPPKEEDENDDEE